jgi:hypothetical protein
MRMSKLIVGVVFLVTALYAARQAYLAFAGEQPYGNDFRCYYTAAWLVRTGQTRDIYLSVRDRDPLLDRDYIGSGTAVSRTAAEHGVTTKYIELYDYPPTLADLISPFTFLPFSTAMMVWYLLDIPALVWAAFLLSRMPGLSLSGRFLPVLAFLLGPPTISCLLVGQVTIYLFLIVVAGMVLYAREMTYSAAFLFALAIAIKLTPLILIIPLVAWRDWKTLRAVALWGVAILAALSMLNGWESLSLYFFHEMPRLGTKFDFLNRSLVSEMQVLWSRSPKGTSLPGVNMAGKVIAVLGLCYAAWQCRSKSVRNLSLEFKVECIAYFLLLSCCLSPVGWVHAYLLGAPALVICGKRIWDGHAKTFEAILFLLLIAALATNTVLPLAVIAPLPCLALGLLGLHRLKRQQIAEGASAMLAPATC